MDFCPCARAWLVELRRRANPCKGWVWSKTNEKSTSSTGFVRGLFKNWRPLVYGVDWETKRLPLSCG